MLPVVGTMLPSCTNTGRPFSLSSANRSTGAKFRSNERCWFRFSEYVPSMFVVNRPSSTAPFHDRFERTVRCGRKFLANSVTLGEAFENTVPVVPSAQRSGTPPGPPSYWVQSGIGTAGPTQLICCVPLGSPVLSSAPPIWPPLEPLANSPIPPRTTARGVRDAPLNAEISCDSPTVHENPTRGLRLMGVGTRSLRRPKAASTAGLKVGVFVYRLASTRRPYW